ncbi:MaoC family dehydratase N-terminal domain-containing protein [Alkalihalobacillus sp. BA299]|uniref:FAS1-like dehydratase domain-containing protein n=1 Tax=Alkalihalobacillus sp. BA299 TaxID=2815938 RepID=UPI001ADCB2D1|nr:MaoC family dehydratase N-terminal domain-containing protein [Alkalihalobacillus sp. BA299]
MNKLLTDELLANIGRSAPPKKELVTRRDIRKYSIATGQRQRKFLDGDEAPPMFHVSLFWDVVELDQLLPDGVSVDKLLPEFPLKKAMAGGLKIDYHKTIFPGDWLIATRTLTDIYEKVGSKGPIIFYEVTMSIENELGEKVITEKTTRLLR